MPLTAHAPGWHFHPLPVRAALPGLRLSGLLRQVLLAAGDTFRAAAAEQLQGWAERSGAQLIARADSKQQPASLLSAALDRVTVPALQAAAWPTASRAALQWNRAMPLQPHDRTYCEGLMMIRALQPTLPCRQ